MFELPECLVLASQMRSTLVGKTISAASTKNVEHKFVWHNLEPKVFAALAHAKRVGDPVVRGRWISLPIEPGYVLLIGECGGSLQFDDATTPVPAKYHLLVQFEDGSRLWARTGMWGAYELYEAGDELKRAYVNEMRVTPVESGFTIDYFSGLVEGLIKAGKRSAKSLLTEDQLIPGLGNAIAQDILFEAKILPKRDLSTLDAEELRSLYHSIRQVIANIVDAGGRYDEKDLFGRAGGYVRKMDKAATRRPCPRCKGRVSEGKYLGGAIYWCGGCQK